ncbi:hypothetical protein CSC30_1231 [Pseudomonas aeruginosa]|nr:hypothetical protein CSB94_4188 [Pseudomonas aeruginosa]AWF58429.1 hypothetical protein CSC30_1231 [Pseudomonas aeruginosa]RCH24094.1 hypothetical protein CSC42_1418 [Pseudomonas aeruginosa]
MERKLHAKDFLVVDRSPLAWAKRDGASNRGDDRSVSPRSACLTIRGGASSSTARRLPGAWRRRLARIGRRIADSA